MTEEKIINLINSNYIKRQLEREKEEEIAKLEKAKDKRLTRRYLLYLFLMLIIIFMTGINI